MRRKAKKAEKKHAKLETKIKERVERKRQTDPLAAKLAAKRFDSAGKERPEWASTTPGITMRKDVEGVVHLSGTIGRDGRLETRPRQDEMVLGAALGVKPTMTQLNVKAAQNLAAYRGELEREVERRYCDAKWAEVKRLVDEAGTTGWVIADLTAEELRQLGVKKP